jgi:hypothetical protein
MLSLYKYIIEAGYWDRAIFEYFPTEFRESDKVFAEWGASTRHTLVALSALDKYIGYLQRLRF